MTPNSLAAAADIERTEPDVNWGAARGGRQCVGATSWLGGGDAAKSLLL